MKEDGIQIRKFRTEDAKKVSEIIRTNLVEVNSKDYPKEVIEKMVELFTPKYILQLSNKRKMFVALQDGKVVGTASIDYDTIYTVFVDVNYQRKGIGEDLLSRLEEIAANNGLRSVKLPASISSQKFYEKLGYQAVSEVESEDFGKDIIMEKYLV